MSVFEQQLMERLEDYALHIIAVYNALPDYPASGYQVAQALGKQLLRSGTSVDANFVEATCTHSLADKAAKQRCHTLNDHDRDSYRYHDTSLPVCFHPSSSLRQQRDGTIPTPLSSPYRAL